MAGMVFFSVSMSIDGFIAPESVEDLMGPRWMELQQWVFPQRPTQSGSGNSSSSEAAAAASPSGRHTAPG